MRNGDPGLDSQGHRGVWTRSRAAAQWPGVAEAAYRSWGPEGTGLQVAVGWAGLRGLPVPSSQACAGLAAAGLETCTPHWPAVQLPSPSL